MATLNFKIRGLIDFEPYPHQQELIDALNSGKNVSLNSARQTGATTALFYYIIQSALESKSNYVIFSPSNYKDEQFKWMLDANDIKYKSHTKLKIVLENDSELIFKSKDRIVEDVENAQVFIEDGKYGDADFYASVWLFMLNNSSSTVRFIQDNHNKTDDNFEKLSWNWDVVPNRDQRWKDQIVMLFGNNIFQSEYEI